MDLRYERNKYLHKVLWGLVAEKFELYKDIRKSFVAFNTVKKVCLEEMRQHGIITSNEYEEACVTAYCFACRQAKNRCYKCPCDWREVELRYDPDEDNYKILRYDIPCICSLRSAYDVLADREDIDEHTYKELCNIIRDSWE